MSVPTSLTGAERTRLGAAFNAGSDRYERLRPTYPADAITWAIGDGPLDVVDIGAGTGKLTRVLVDLGHRVTAVEPAPAMLVQLRAALPGTPAVGGTGEATGLPDRCADALVYGQSWHWVEPVAGTAEAARLLRPGGTMAMLWNLMDLGTPWVTGLNEVMHSLSGPVERTDSGDRVTTPMTDHEVRRFPWTVATTAADLADLVTTRSYYLAMDEADQAELRARVRDFVERTHGGVDDREVAFPHVTEVVRYRRP